MSLDAKGMAAGVQHQRVNTHSKQDAILKAKDYSSVELVTAFCLHQSRKDWEKHALIDVSLLSI